MRELMYMCVCVCVCVLCQLQGISLEKKEARAEKEEADRFQRLKEELVSECSKIMKALAFAMSIAM